MKYYYVEGNRKIYLTLKKASPEWVNFDCPYLYDEEDNKVIAFDYFDKKVIAKDKKEAGIITKFIKASDKAFCKKYRNMFQWQEGNIVKNIYYII